jgi:hypothetical protein
VCRTLAPQVRRFRKTIPSPAGAVGEDEAAVVQAGTAQSEAADVDLPPQRQSKRRESVPMGWLPNLRLFRTEIV